jgi:Fe2+ transport system protein FeoA
MPAVAAVTRIASAATRQFPGSWPVQPQLRGRGDGRMEEPRARSLSVLRPGERGILVRVSDADPEILRQLTRLGIGLGQEVEVLAEREAGTLAVRVAGVPHALAASVVAAMQVEVDDQA